MKAFSVNPKTKEVKEIEIDMQPNTVYTFFNSILVDDIDTLPSHTIYTDANAISNDATPFYIGNQLLVGDALIIGKEGIEEIDVSIPLDELTKIVNYEVSDFYKETLKLLGTSDINLYNLFEIKKEDGELIQLNTEWVLYVFSIADAKTQVFFIHKLKTAVETEEDMLQHIQKMAVLALQAGA